MQFPGYFVEKTDDGVSIKRATYDDTELSEASNWTQIHENEGSDGSFWGGISLDDALEAARKILDQSVS